MNNRIHTIGRLMLLLILCAISGCEQPPSYQQTQGEVFGTYYRIQFQGKELPQEAIDSVFQVINSAVNSYTDNSEISAFNRTGELSSPSPTFVDMLDKAKEYHQRSEGYFEPTLRSLSRAWGFGLQNKPEMDSVKVDSLLPQVGFLKNISWDTTSIKRLHSGTELDLSAMGEGYALDAMAVVMERAGITNYLLEIGGEMKAKGVNAQGKPWKVGIENPSKTGEAERTYDQVVELRDMALSTSGNYRKFYIDESGTKRPHILDPYSGFPVSHTLLSVSLKSSSALTADAMATACMAMGPEKAKQFILDSADIEGLLIFEADGKLDSWHSPNFFN